MKYTIQNLTMGVVKLRVDMGKDIGLLTIRDRIESVSVDVGMESSKICIIQHLRDQKEARIFDLKGCDVKDVAELLNDIILIGKPKNLCLDGYGLALAVKDSLYSKLLKRAIIVEKDGTIMYDLGEEYSRLLG